MNAKYSTFELKQRAKYSALGLGRTVKYLALLGFGQIHKYFAFKLKASILLELG